MEKHSFYFRIIESFESNECPLCFYVNEEVERYFDSLLYEGVNDFGFIQKFRENKGFCNFHTYKLLSYKNATSTATLYFYLFKDILSDLKSFNKKNLKRSKSCQVCELIDSIERMYLSSFVNFSIEEEFKEKFLKSAGFCLPHFLDLSEFFKKEMPQWLLDFQYKKFEQIFTDIKNYLDFMNFSLGEKRPKLTREQQLIYQKAIKMFSGYNGKKY
jgi:hypothetical protein